MKKLILIFCVFTLIAGCGRAPAEDPGKHDDHGHESERRDEHGGERHEEEPQEVHLSEAYQHMIGLKRFKVEKGALVTTLDIVGEIAQETEDVTHITSPEPGTLTSYRVSLGDTVEENTPLCVVQTKAGAAIEIVSPSHGEVIAEYVKPGGTLDTLTSIMTIADPDLLRASFDVYERDLARIKVGQRVWVSSAAYPDQKFDGEVVYISPRVDSRTRTIKTRVNIKNEEHLLKFGMFVSGEVELLLSEGVLTVPVSSVQTVQDQKVVFVSTEEEAAFAVRPVTIGRASGDTVEVLAGLEEGEHVVEKGSFYLKSELAKEQFGDGHAH